MRRSIALFAVLLCAPLCVAADADALRGRVVDSASREPIPFANVGVPNAGVGTVGSEEGAFELDELPAEGALLFSAIGYESLRLPLTGFPEDGVVSLKPIEAAFHEEISVTADGDAEASVFGKSYDVPGYGFGFSSGRLGSEVAGRIRIKKRTLIETANFTITRTGGARFLYRVNVYDYSGGEIGENLLEENVIVSAKQERGVLSVDLREHLLVVEDDVLLALEWIRADEEMGNARIMFRAKPRTRANLYYKPTSQMPFVPIPRHGVGFFLTGFRLD